MALNKAVLALALAAMVLVVAPTVPAVVAQQDFDCFCDCMRTKCITIPKATKEECAPACNDGCIDAGSKGQPHPGEFCGL